MYKQWSFSLYIEDTEIQKENLKETDPQNEQYHIHVDAKCYVNSALTSQE